MLRTLVLVVLPATLVWGCNLSATKAPSVTGWSPDSPIDDDEVEFFVGEVEFYDIRCGVPVDIKPRLRRAPPNPLDEYRLTHSMLIFRGRVFEWGVSPFSLQYRNYGSMDRNPDQKCIKWDHESRGSSTCSLKQAQDWADKYYITEGQYDLMLNNCHMFVNRLIDYLNTGC